MWKKVEEFGDSRLVIVGLDWIGLIEQMEIQIGGCSTITIIY
jgi:hypothetical protein